MSSVAFTRVLSCSLASVASSVSILGKLIGFHIESRTRGSDSTPLTLSRSVPDRTLSVLHRGIHSKACLTD